MALVEESNILSPHAVQRNPQLTAFTGTQTGKGGVITQINCILFPHDFSENASKIVPYVQSMAKAYNSKIYVFHVVQDLQRWGKA